MSKTLTTTAAIGTALVLSTGPASAAVLDHRHFQDSGSEPFLFCGVDGRVSWNDRVHELVKTKRSGRLVHFAANVHGTTRFLNLETGGVYTQKYNFADRDIRVVDNGDGTLTIIFQNSGSSRWYDAEGNKVFTVAGNFRAEIVVDHGGTPADPSDDEEISFEVIREPRNDRTRGRDFCADFVEFTS